MELTQLLDPSKTALVDEARRMRDEAKLLPPGAAREAMMRRARQAETGSRIIARFRAEVEECLCQADRAVGEADREAWLRMAGEWKALADDADRRRT
jgi:hypothetical protein